MTRVGNGFSDKTRKNSIRGAETQVNPKNHVVAATQTNGHAHAKRAGVK
jgi:hypothetical protein